MSLDGENHQNKIPFAIGSLSLTSFHWARLIDKDYNSIVQTTQEILLFAGKTPRLSRVKWPISGVHLVSKQLKPVSCTPLIIHPKNDFVKHVNKAANQDHS